MKLYNELPVFLQIEAMLTKTARIFDAGGLVYILPCYYQSLCHPMFAKY